MDTKQLWQGKFGDDYLKRNRIRWLDRKPFFEMILDVTMARSVFEFGCNAGWNLSAIKRAYPDVQVEGYDINSDALEQAASTGLVVDDMLNLGNQSELSFSAGVLIHIPPEDLERAMMQIILKSCDWVLAVEYYAPEETEIEYQGQMGLLWKRDYGKLYQELGLELVSGGIATGFDDCKYWLFRKWANEPV